MNKTILKNNAALVGKLLAVEIEYIKTPGLEDVSNIVPGGSEALLSVVNDGTPNGGVPIKEIRLLTVVNEEGRLHDLLDLDIKGKPNKNCGLHVHVDARHLGTNGLLGAKETYDRLTNNETRGGKTIRYCFKRLLPKSRHGNKYCPWRNNRYGSAYFRSNPHGNRYAAFNFDAFGKHGTIEFRMGAGSTNKNKIEMWALLCQFILNYAANPLNEMPATWAQFLNILPETRALPLRSWAKMRHEQVSGALGDNFSRVAASLVSGISEE